MSLDEQTQRHNHIYLGDVVHAASEHGLHAVIIFFHSVRFCQRLVLQHGKRVQVNIRPHVNVEQAQFKGNRPNMTTITATSTTYHTT